jgi:alpha-L-rhamnosidase
MVNQRTYPGWGYMVENGATTCWEQWNGFYSQIHSCFPYIGSWFYRGLGGIQWDPENPGFKKIILRPAPVKSVDWVNCKYESPYGEIVSNWKIDKDVFLLDVKIPVNTTALIYVPTNDMDKITESGIAAGESEYVNIIGMEGNFAIYEVGSGSYTFRSPCKKI